MKGVSEPSNVLHDLEDLAQVVKEMFDAPMGTLSNIAAQAGVSEATVSRVLNDKSG